MQNKCRLAFSAYLFCFFGDTFGQLFPPHQVIGESIFLFCRAEPRKKKKVDPRREIMARERLKKKLRKLEKVPPEFIPIEDFITSAKCFDEMRVRSEPRLSFEESERRALLHKEWTVFKLAQHQAEMAAIKGAMEAQRQALEELRLESEELYQAALAPDPGLFPFTQQGPSYTPPLENYEPPEGTYHDKTKVYTQ